MTWLLSSHGNVIDLNFVKPGDEISVRDIAHHLAQINRFSGAAARPYSVAEHSLVVVEIMEREMGVHSPDFLLCALMHDAHEAYTSDLSSPMKQVIGDAWRTVEDRAQQCVLSRWKLTDAWAQIHHDVKAADLRALATERAQLLPPAGPVWPTCEVFPPVTWLDIRSRDALTWDDWRQAFLEKWAELWHHWHLLQTDEAEA